MSETVPGTVPEAVPAPKPANGTPPELSAKEKRALREQARREFKAAERERLEQEKPGSAPSASSPTVAAPAASNEPARTDAQRLADAAVFLRGVLFPVLAVLAVPFGYRLELADFTPEKAKDDADAWVPILRRYRWLDLLVTWVGAPARVLSRVRELARPRERKETPPK